MFILTMRVWHCAIVFLGVSECNGNPYGWGSKLAPHLRQSLNLNSYQLYHLSQATTTTTPPPSGPLSRLNLIIYEVGAIGLLGKKNRHRKHPVLSATGLTGAKCRVIEHMRPVGVQ